MTEPSPAVPDEPALSAVERGCAETPLFFGVGVVGLFVCALLSNLVGDWIVRIWPVAFIVALSWRWRGPWVAVLAMIAVGAGWILMFGLPTL